MPFYNFGYTGNRLLPIAMSDADFSFRIWINNGTSIERIISVSKSKEFGEESFLDEISVDTKGNKTVKFYSKRRIIPSKGIEKFIQTIDSLNLYDYHNQKIDDAAVELHKPFSLYVVEIKNKDKYYCFKFTTLFPKRVDSINKYYRLQDLIFEEFKYKFYFSKN